MWKYFTRTDDVPVACYNGHKRINYWYTNGENGMKKEILYKNLEQYLGRQYKRRIPMLSGTILAPIQRFGPDINMKSLEALLKRRGESFSECLLRMIDKSGRTDADVYNAAHIDRRVFSKIRSSKDYQPKKETAMAFCIGLQLNMDDAKNCLGVQDTLLPMAPDRIWSFSFLLNIKIMIWMNWMQHLIFLGKDADHIKPY